ncbi:MAG: FHA domain-containing protein [Planctomycetes bacterium]|nr:FHA domain-containing protein [Planctomycetota bacterium]
MILYLQHERGDGEVDTYHLKPGRRYHIGRGSTCEVRILDLKLSRKHSALEWMDGAWRFLDLGSTNGCRLDGEEVLGATAVHPGSRIELGQTTLLVARLADDQDDPDATPTVATVSEPPKRHRTPAELMPDEESSAATAAAAVERKSGEIPPEAMASDPTPLANRALPPAAPAAAPAAPAPAAAATQPPTTKIPAGEATFFVTVLGRRIGPLARPQARELKARELRGDLKPEDLDGLPQG